KKMVWELENLMEGLTAVTSTLELDEVLNQVLASVAKAAEAQIGVLALEEESKLAVRAAVGSDPDTGQRLALELGGEVCQDVLHSGQAFMHFEDKPGAAAGPLDPRAVLCVPLL